MKKIYFYDHIYFQSLNVVLISFALYFSPIDLECDGTTQIAFAKSILLSLSELKNLLIHSYRAPLFSFSTIISGMFLFDSFNPLLIFNSLLALLMPSLTYFAFILYNRKLALFSSFILILSLIPYIQIKLILGTHLMTFNTIACLSFLFLFLKTLKSRDLILCLIFSFSMFFTRWEGIFLFIGNIVLLFCLLFFSINNSFNYKIKKNFIKTTLIFLIIIVFWLFLKSYFFILKDDKVTFEDIISSFGSMHNASGAQLLWKVQNSHSDLILNDKFYLNIDSSLLNKQRFISKKGNYGNKIYNIILNYLKNQNINYYDQFKSMMPLDGTSDRAGEESKIFYDHFGKFNGDAQKITNNMFNENFKSYHYVFIIPKILKEEVGQVKADSLLKKWSNELIFQNKIIFLRVFEDFFSYYGISLRPLLSLFIKNKFPQLPVLYKNITPDRIYLKDQEDRFILGYWENFLWYNIDFNMGNCAQNTLSEKMFIQYQNTFKKNYKTFYSESINEVSSFTRNLTRNILGPLIILIFIFQLFFNRKVTTFILFSSYSLLIFALSYAAGGIYLKYDNYIIPILIYLFIYNIYDLVSYFKKE